MSEEEDFDESEAWLCACGNYIIDGCHCPMCGREPPWGCPCDQCQSPDENFEDDFGLAEAYYMDDFNP